MSLYSELKRRNVFRVAIAYLAAAWLLTEVAGTLFPGFGIPDWAFRFVVIVLAIGFLPTLVFSWAYEITPEGLKREKEVVRDESVTHLTAKRLDRITIGLIVLAIAFIVADRVWLSPKLAQPVDEPTVVVSEPEKVPEPEAVESLYPPNSIAVLPFVNMSADADNEYFADGVSEELLNLLAKIPELRVTSRSSSFHFKGKDAKIADISRDLKVAHVLEGSVRKAGNQVRVTAQLIETTSDIHLWSETYDRTLDDIFTIQDEIASAVVAELKPALLGRVPQADAIDTEAYTLYLQAVHVGQQMSPGALEQSNSLLERALAIHPDFARGWRLLARNYATQANRDFLSREEGNELARQAIDRALAIDPDLAVAHSWLAARTAAEFGGDLENAAERFRRALFLEPNNYYVLSHAADFMRMLGRQAEAIAIQEYLVEVDPLNPIAHNNLCWYYLHAGLWNEALSTARTLRLLSPDYGGLNVKEGFALLQKGEHEAALTMILNEPVEYWRLTWLVKAYHTMERTDQSGTVLAELIEKYGSQRPFAIATAFAYRNEANPAFDWLETAVQNKSSSLHYVVSDSSFNNIQEDQRWLPFLRRIGRSPEELAAIDFKIELPQ